MVVECPYLAVASPESYTITHNAALHLFVSLGGPVRHSHARLASRGTSAWSLSPLNQLQQRGGEVGTAYQLTLLHLLPPTAVSRRCRPCCRTPQPD